MTIAYAKVVGEISSGFVTLVFNPDLTGTDALNNTASELITTVPVDTVPQELREPDVDVWFANERLNDAAKSRVKKVFPMTSDEIPAEYYTWLEEIGIDRESS